MSMVRPMSGLAAVLQTWPLGDLIGVRQQYPTLFRYFPKPPKYPLKWRHFYFIWPSQLLEYR